MKIGILTMQRIVNYGSFLQAYGTKHLLECLGHQVIFLDYRSEKPVVPYSKISLVMHILRNSELFTKLEDDLRWRRRFPAQYRKKFLPMLGITYKKNYDEQVDIAVIGSDEVFNCLQPSPNVGFSPMLFGQGLNAKKVISYAASFGYTTLTGLQKYRVSDTVGSYLSTFSAISVRDKNSCDIVSSLVGYRPPIHIDPVLISEYSLPAINVEHGSYIILYTYPERKYSKEEQDEICAFCRKNGKSLLSFANAQTWVDQKINADPFEVLAFFNYADFIITDTFHGAVLSMKYHKNFACLIRNDNKQKLGDLLYRLKKEETIISDFSELEERYRTSIDYQETQMLIEQEKESALSYLRQYTCSI